MTKLVFLWSNIGKKRFKVLIYISYSTSCLQNAEPYDKPFQKELPPISETYAEIEVPGGDDDPHTASIGFRGPYSKNNPEL